MVTLHDHREDLLSDESGNIRYKGSTRNFNPMMASAADIVIAEVEKIVPAGEIGPDVCGNSTHLC
ncbi:MAG: CoA-transferase [Eubacterium ramulus]